MKDLLKVVGFIALVALQTTMVFGQDAGTAGLAYTAINNNNEYSVKAGTAISGAIVIPANHNNRPVTVVAIGGFENLPGITSVVIGGNVAKIELNAFKGCVNLARLTIPNSVTSIGGSAFENTGISTIVISNNVDTLGPSAFRGCKNLTSATIGNRVTAIGLNTFEGCRDLTTVVIGNNVTTIGGNAFANCTSLSKVTIGSKVTSIETNAFLNCTSLTSIVIPASVTSLKMNSFSKCDNLTSITLQGTISKLGFSNNAFPGDIQSTYFIKDERSGGIGTYTRANSASKSWLKK
ncbi:MAG: leucine-rich repeat domain-containing protein [Treponema sp.]|nr:leucine-rich repeat domain-containing protein [Treponema sp.]MCL2272819.1 leucine-rich repeat domain-containing protein [Treponema sp.]